MKRTINIPVMIAIHACLNLAHVTLVRRQGLIGDLRWGVLGIDLLQALRIFVEHLDEIFNNACAPLPLVSFFACYRHSLVFY